MGRVIVGVASVQFHSEAIGKSTTYNVILPERVEGPFPVLIQLHGLSDDGNVWIQRSNLVRYVARMPLLARQTRPKARSASPRWAWPTLQMVS